VVWTPTSPWCRVVPRPGAGNPQHQQQTQTVAHTAGIFVQRLGVAWSCLQHPHMPVHGLHTAEEGGEGLEACQHWCAHVMTCSPPGVLAGRQPAPERERESYAQAGHGGA
jgi:hypothetical protein